MSVTLFLHMQMVSGSRDLKFMAAYRCVCMLHIYLINEDFSAKAGLTQSDLAWSCGKKMRPMLCTASVSTTSNTSIPTHLT